MGRAARHIEGHVIMYADTITLSMHEAIEETKRRRQIQEDYNKEHGITPQGIKKAIKDITERVAAAVAEDRVTYDASEPSPGPATKEEVTRLIKELEVQMKQAAKNLEFEKAALLRDRIIELRREFEFVDIARVAAMDESSFGRGRNGASAG
jgi:excinuclease ABC subunit B